MTTLSDTITSLDSYRRKRRRADEEAEAGGKEGAAAVPAASPEKGGEPADADAAAGDAAAAAAAAAARSARRVRKFAAAASLVLQARPAAATGEGTSEDGSSGGDAERDTNEVGAGAPSAFSSTAAAAALEARLEELRSDTAAVLVRRRDAAVELADLSSSYLYGLEAIAKLNDLRGAPDAILPGNFRPIASSSSKAAGVGSGEGK